MGIIDCTKTSLGTLLGYDYGLFSSSAHQLTYLGMFNSGTTYEPGHFIGSSNRS